MHRTFLLLLLFALGAPAHADEGGGTSKDGITSKRVAAELVAAWDAGDRSKTTKVASSDWPDPWYVAFRLCLAGRGDIARAIAGVEDLPDIEALPDQLDRWCALEPNPTLLAAWDPLERAYEATAWKQLATATEAALDSGVPFLDTAAAYLRGRALFNLARPRNAPVPDEASLRKALPALERALAGARDLQWLAVEGSTCWMLGSSQLALGRPDDATEYFKQSVALQDRRRAYRGAALLRLNLGITFHDLGAYRSAVRELTDALRIFERLSGQREAIARVLVTRAHSLRLLGEYAAALDDIVKSRALFVELKQDRWVARADIALASVRIKMGDPRRARKAATKALEVYERLERESDIARAEGTLGIIASEEEDWIETIRWTESARIRFVAIGDDLGAAAALNNIGAARGRGGDRPKALQESRAALAVFREKNYSRGVVASLTSIGEFEAAEGNDAAAHAALDEAHRLAKEIENAEGIIETAAELARFHFAKKRYAKATEFARVGIETMRQSVRGLNQIDVATARAPWSGLFDTGVRSAAAIRHAREFFYFLESGRARALLNSLEARETLRAAAIPKSLIEREDAAREKEAQHRNRLRDARAAGNLIAARDANRDLDKALSELREVFDAMHRHNESAMAVLYPQPAVLDTQRDEKGTVVERGVREGMGEDDALVEYAFVGEKAYALVVTRRDARVVSLGATKEIDARAGAVAAMLAANEKLKPGVLEGLAKALVGKLRLKKGIRRLLVLPDGNIHLLPLRALMPQYEVVCVPAGSTLLLMGTAGEPGTGVLAMGDPAYEQAKAAGAGARSETRSGSKLRRLPATRAEAEAVGTRVLLGEGATEAALRDALAARKGRWRALHFACHGLVDEERPMRSALALTRAAPDDGFVTALDVLDMDVECDLVVLSACDSGRGKVYRGEGLMGLASSFMLAGAPRLLVSLWKVNDKATQALMIKFYELWNPKDGSKGLRASEALAKAQDHVRSQKGWEHPYYWAAWVLWGLPE